MPFYNLDRMEVGAIGPQYSTARGAVVLGEHLELARVHFEAGKGAKPHHHPHEQMFYVLKGSLRIRVGKEVLIAEQGDVVHIPSGEEHEVQPLEDVDAISFKNLVGGKGSPRE